MCVLVAWVGARVEIKSTGNPGSEIGECLYLQVGLTQFTVKAGKLYQR